MTLSRGKVLVRLGSYSVILGLLCAWASERPLPSPLSEIFVVFMFLLLGLGIFVLLVGCIVLCFKEQPWQLLRAGLISSAVSVLVVPAVASMAGF
jgi:cytochrome bd-type quinol oxidase subunit 1